LRKPLVRRDYLQAAGFIAHPQAPGHMVWGFVFSPIRGFAGTLAESA